MEQFKVTANNGGTHLVGSQGTQVYVESPDESESGVIAQRVSSMLNHHNRQAAFELGHTNSYSGSSRLPGVVGSDHVEDRPKLLETAHQAEAQAEQWDRYRVQVRKVLYPPDIAEIDATPGIDHYSVTTEPSFRRVYPRNARPIPQELREALLLATAYATENMQAYLDVADACRQEYENRYSGENAALRDQAQAQMDDELGKD